MLGVPNLPQPESANSFALRRDANDELKFSQERRVEVHFLFDRHDDEAAMFFDALPQISHLGVGVTVVSVFDLGTFAEKRVGFVEVKDRAAFLRGVEQAAQIFFRFTDVLVHDPGEINALEVEFKLAGQRARRLVWLFSAPSTTRARRRFA
jgi:hypothetical protein